MEVAVSFDRGKGIAEIEIDSNSGENPLLNESEEVEEPKRRMCFSSRKRTKKSEINPLKPSLSTKIDFQARVRTTLQKDGRFMLTTVNLDRNHDLIPTDSHHFAMNKKILTPMKRRLEINDQEGIGVSRNYKSIVVEAGGYESLTFDERDARNYIDRARRLRVREGDADTLQKYFLRMQTQNSSFYYMIDVDTDFRIRNLFWAYAMSRAAYEEFGDVVSCDTTYLTNKNDMSFALFVGLNHHGQSILLGCVLLSSKNTDKFVWLLKA
ncbi:protein FAR-RED IMPAIRED RESPONSE 1-like [Camellia sinensis]|uniref:protein FAR-RED IMPAIRED RESPONSE 1-like n=1 Tax=Camellia sinensis TaxID=4442 RepID=UPI0010366F24|nr:protein FAR-RED IMPAIRED RESPONSE 1-like [Camellia sinensis]